MCLGSRPDEGLQNLAIAGEYMIGARIFSLFTPLDNEGKLFLYQPHLAIEPFGAGCPGAGGFQPELSVSGCVVPGATVTVDVENALGGSVALLAAGVTATAAAIGQRGCSLLVDPLAPIVVLPLSGAGPGNGAVQVSVVFSSGVAAFDAALQAFVADPSSVSGFVTTNATWVRAY